MAPVPVVASSSCAADLVGVARPEESSCGVDDQSVPACVEGRRGFLVLDVPEAKGASPASSATASKLSGAAPEVPAIVLESSGVDRESLGASTLVDGSDHSLADHSLANRALSSPASCVLLHGDLPADRAPTANAPSSASSTKVGSSSSRLVRSCRRPR